MRFIPYTKATEDFSADQAMTMEPVNRERLPHVINQLEKKYMQDWTEARKNQIFDEIGQFAKRISTLGEKNGVIIVKKYGDDLGAHVESFDVEKMNTTLNDYPQLVEKTRSLL
jgi:hypothetical protein